MGKKRIICGTGNYTEQYSIVYYTVQYRYILYSILYRIYSMRNYNILLDKGIEIKGKYPLVQMKTYCWTWEIS